MFEVATATVFYVLTLVYIWHPLPYPYRRFSALISFVLGTFWAIVVWRHF